MKSCRPSIATLVASAERIINILVTYYCLQNYTNSLREKVECRIYMYTHKKIMLSSGITYENFLLIIIKNRICITINRTMML